MTSLLRIIPHRGHVQSLSRTLHLTSVNYDFKWRLQKGLPQCHRREPEFYETPDFSFLDGRPVPVGAARMKRIVAQQGFGERVVKLLGQVDYALKREEIHKELKQKEDEAILRRKLKPKGIMYKPIKSATKEP